MCRVRSDGGTGGGEDADHREGVVAMLGQADGGDTMGQHDPVAQLIVQRLGHLGAQHHLEDVVEGATLGQP